MAADDIYEIDEYNEQFWEGSSADTDLGMNIVRGNTIVNEQVDAGDTRRSTLTGAYTHKYSGGWQALVDAVMSFDLYSDLDFKITVYDRYESQPPVGNKKNDTGVTLGLNWSY